MVDSPVFVPSWMEVAVTVSVVAVSLAATCRYPPLVTVVPDAAPPVTVHCTPWFTMPVPTTAADSCRSAPLERVAVAGVTVTLVMVGAVGVKAAAWPNGEQLMVFHTWCQWFQYRPSPLNHCADST